MTIQELEIQLREKGTLLLKNIEKMKKYQVFKNDIMFPALLTYYSLNFDEKLYRESVDTFNEYFDSSKYVSSEQMLDLDMSYFHMYKVESDEFYLATVKQVYEDLIERLGEYKPTVNFNNPNYYSFLLTSSEILVRHSLINKTNIEEVLERYIDLVDSHEGDEWLRVNPLYAIYAVNSEDSIDDIIERIDRVYKYCYYHSTRFSIKKDTLNLLSIIIPLYNGNFLETSSQLLRDRKSIQRQLELNKNNFSEYEIGMLVPLINSGLYIDDVCDFIQEELTHLETFRVFDDCKVPDFYLRVVILLLIYSILNENSVLDNMYDFTPEVCNVVYTLVEQDKEN